MFRLRTFGGLTLERDGSPYAGAAVQRRRLAVLALLASSESGMSREKLAAYLWPDADPARARHSVDDALSALRRALGSEELFLGVASVRLNPEKLTSDVAEHAASIRAGDLAGAVALHAGPFLDGFFIPGTDAFERWAEEERTRLARVHARALESLAAAATLRGDPTAAVHWWRERVAVDPLDTSASLGLLNALAQSGNTAEALRAARVHEALVREELDCAPGPEWAAAVAELRRDAVHAAGPVRIANGGSSQADASPAPDDPGERLIDVATATGGAPLALLDAPHPAAGSTPRTSSRWGAGRRVSIVTALVLSCVLVVGVVWSKRSRPVPPRNPAAPARVLVVPFENATGDSALAPLGRMAADWVAQGLTQVNGLEVTTDFTPTSQTGNAELLQKALDHEASTVVSGAFYSDGDSLRLQMHVTDVAGWTLHGGIRPVSASRGTPTALLEPARQRVMVDLAVEHDPRYAALATGAVPPTYAAYEQYLAGTALFERGDWAAALPFYARAAALDSSYVQPLLGAADGELNLGRPASADSLVRRLERRTAALTTADRGSVDRLRGILDGDVMMTLAGARASAAAAPGSQLASFLHAASALRAGFPREAIVAAAPVAASFGRVRTPWTGSVYWSVVTAAYHVLGDHAGERAAAHTALTYHPDSRDVRAYDLRALAALGRTDSVRLGLDELESIPPTPGSAPLATLLVALAQELDAHGQHDESRATLRRAISYAGSHAAPANSPAAAPFDLALAHYLLDEYDEAARRFGELAVEQPDNPRYLAYCGLVAARSGQPALAARIADRLAALRRPYDRGQTSYARAQLAATRGDRATSLVLLRRAFAEGFTYGTALHMDREFAPLRKDPEFAALLTGHR